MYIYILYLIVKGKNNELLPSLQKRYSTSSN